MKLSQHLAWTLLPALLTGGQTVAGAEFLMTPHWDVVTPLANPHKGWYHHFPDNHLTARYPIGDDNDLLVIPGMDHLYMRLAWSYLEPVEGEYRWEVIDPTIAKWTGRGLGIAFRISCRETGTDRIEQQFATPKWVIDAGARGGHYLKGKETDATGPWEPDFSDPVFLDKLEQFLKAFAARYDGQPWLRYVDIGSIGDWGEGHTHSGSRKEYGFEIRQRHIDLHKKYFVRSPLVVTDDFVYSVGDPQQRQRLHRYVVDSGISYRDDSILVDGYIRGYTKTWTVRSPEFFADTYLKRPTILELEHYSSVTRLGNWSAQPDSSVGKYGGGRTGPDYFRGALELLHATYIGYHGYADKWWPANSKLSNELLNRCGYWYFLHRVDTGGTWRTGQDITLTTEWSNRGVAPAYHDYQLCLRLTGPRQFDVRFPAGNRAWLPGLKSVQQVCRVQLPADMPAGSYVLQLKLVAPQAERDVQLALKTALRDRDGFYRIGEVSVEP
jgi:hypothetical protein